MLRKLLVVGALVLLPAAAQAAAVVTSVGPRVGVSIDPDQVVLGGQMQIAEFAPNWSFDPNVELGFGDDVTTIQLNFDAYYHFRIRGSEWRPYVGPGLGIAFYSWDAPPGFPDHSDTEVGLNVVGGFTFPAGSGKLWFTELRLGVGDLPDFKIVGGLNFRM